MSQGSPPSIAMPPLARRSVTIRRLSKRLGRDVFSSNKGARSPDRMRSTEVRGLGAPARLERGSHLLRRSHVPDESRFVHESQSEITEVQLPPRISLAR